MYKIIINYGHIQSLEWALGYWAKGLMHTVVFLDMAYIRRFLQGALTTSSKDPFPSCLNKHVCV